MSIPCTVYIDEAGDLGFGTGTQWFVLSAIIVDKDQEPKIRESMARIKTRLNVREIHLRKIKDFYRRAYIVRELDCESFTYVNIIADTNKLDRTRIATPLIAYNYLCRLLLERVSWFLRDTDRQGDIVLSARGTARDGELIQYIREKLFPYEDNEIVETVFGNITAKAASSWDMLQLADVCATSMFLAYEVNGYGYRTPCFSALLKSHLYRRGTRLESYGLKYFTPNMKPDPDEFQHSKLCTKIERTPGTTST